VDQKASDVWTKMSSGWVRCAYIGCQVRPSPADVERLEGEIVTVSKMRVTIRMGGLPAPPAAYPR
jgi:hypothetical protein